MASLIDKRGRIERIFGNWLRELNVTFRFFQQKYDVEVVPDVFLTGGSAMFSGLPEFLSDYLETNCMVFNPLESLKTDKKISEEVLKQGAVFAPCLGLLAK